MTQNILLTTVFKPFGVDDMYGRAENIPELMIAQVTREQSIFSPRLWHANTGLHLIASNCSAPTTVVEWPSIEEFKQELQSSHYDYIGINFIPCTLQKMRRMVEVARETSPGSKIVIGGQGTIVPGLESLVDVDYICRGDGIRYIRHLLGKSPVFEFSHPIVQSQVIEWLGLPVIPPQPVGQIATGLGCRNGCDFCVTSAFFDCQYLPFLSDGAELFDLIQNHCRDGEFSDIYLFDENFLQDTDRALSLHEVCTKNADDFIYYNLDMIWSSSNNVQKIGPRRLAEMGVTAVWIGYESKYADYPKNKNIDMARLIDDLGEYGITVLLSCVMFYDFHDEKTWKSDLDHFINCGQAYSQFIPIQPWPGTALHQKLTDQERIIELVPWEERHGLLTLFHQHPHTNVQESGKMVVDAFKREYDANGPSILRAFRTRVRGYNTFRESSSPVLKRRAQFLGERLRKGIRWVIATRDLVKAEHREMVEEVIGEFRTVFGNDAADQEVNKAKRLAALSRKAVQFRGGNEISTIQPELKRTTYPQA